MPLVSDAREYYRRAYRGGFAMPAFNVCDLEMGRGAVEAAEAERAPVLLQTYPGDLDHGGGPLITLLRSIAEEARTPVILHLDHGEGFEMAVSCLRRGYASVMFDGSDLPLERNIAETRRVADVAHAFAASVEGELGLFGGDHGSVVFTDPEEAARFVAESGADTLAVSVGSEHHQSRRLDLERLREISTSTRHPLVLHGGSGIHPDDVREAVRMGVVKVNIGHAVSLAMTGAARDTPDDTDHYEMLKLMRARVREKAAEKIRLMGAAGRA